MSTMPPRITKLGAEQALLLTGRAQLALLLLAPAKLLLPIPSLPWLSWPQQNNRPREDVAQV
jgi:hypothetical protein